jgi:hypothetical protein
LQLFFLRQYVFYSTLPDLVLTFSLGFEPQSGGEVTRNSPFFFSSWFSSAGQQKQRTIGRRTVISKEDFNEATDKQARKKLFEK